MKFCPTCGKRTLRLIENTMPDSLGEYKEVRTCDGCNTLVNIVMRIKDSPYTAEEGDEYSASTGQNDTEATQAVFTACVDESLSKSPLDFHQAVAKINLSKVSVMSTDRSISRKEQARLARKLFGALKLKGISVTAPNYSMAQSVDVRIPTGKAMHFIKRTDYIAAVANNQAENKIRQILAIAFPNHDDRSDTQTDYHNYKWSIRG